MKSLDPATLAVRAGLESDPSTGAVVPPIHLSSTYAFEKFGVKGKYDYSRSGNPTRDLLADALNRLEGGAGAVVTSTWLFIRGATREPRCLRTALCEAS